MLNEIIDSNLLNTTDRVAVGVSGGADSMLLLSSLFALKKNLGFHLVAVHINHHLRGSESDRDSKFVSDFCKKHKIDAKIIDVDVMALKKDKKLTVEEAARQLRYDAINKFMKQEKLNKLFLAHHQNDQAETILMNICRGSGISGAVGIKNQGQIYRPLLKLTKAEILKLCRENKIDFVTDSTNLENDATRNYFRNVVIPEIEKVYPEAVRAIASFGERCGEIQEFIDSQIKDSFLVQDDEGVLINGEVFSLPSCIVREYSKRAFQKMNVFADIEAKHYRLIEELFTLPVNSMIDLPHKISAKKCHLGVKLCKKSPKIQKNEEYEFVIGETNIPAYGKIVVEIVSEFDVSYGDGSFYIDYYKVSNNAVWRFRRVGDEFAKLGSGTKKLGDYFTDKKVDSELRDKIPVLASGSTVYVVAGYDISNSVKLVGPTDKIAKITFLKK